MSQTAEDLHRTRASTRFDWSDPLDLDGQLTRGPPPRSATPPVDYAHDKLATSRDSTPSRNRNRRITDILR